LKWPNDIYLNGRKAGGILSESVPGWRDRLVVGIGVNVNNRLQGAAERGQGAGDQGKLSGIAVSLVEFDGIERNLTGVLAAILDEFERWWEVLLNAGFGSIAEAYRGRCLLTGKTVTIQQHEEEKICGVCRGLDPYGGLLLGTPHGEKAVISGTVVAWQE
jgi:BirA family biotin operon repressor/biotin-[acetyl-CoA-carboxylase] ligase